jgi:hypothetical protein
MLLRPGGLDIFYIDESHDSKLYAVTAIAVPFLRNVDGSWRIVWPDQLLAAQTWRKRISKELKNSFNGLGKSLKSASPLPESSFRTRYAVPMTFNSS